MFGSVNEMKQSLAIVIMGVAGCGKSTVGVRLSKELGWDFKDADDFHPPANVAKMAAGMPLDDEDRAPWLLSIRQHLEAAFERNESVIVTCSALRERYRGIVVCDPQRVKLVYLQGDYALLLERISQRAGHFMKDTMLKSQFEALEPPTTAFTVSVSLSPEEIVARIRQEFGV